MNIISKVGLTITTNKDSVKSILDKYKISYGNGSTGEIIKAVFTGIKGGNKNLATDIAGLVQAQDQAAKKAFSGLSFKDAFTKAKAEIFDKIHLSKQKVQNSIPVSTRNAAVPSTSNPKAQSQFYADGSNGATSTGDPVADLALQLTNALNTTDVDTATNIAANAQDPSKQPAWIPLAILAVIAIVGFYLMRKK